MCIIDYNRTVIYFMIKRIKVNKTFKWRGETIPHLSCEWFWLQWPDLTWVRTLFVGIFIWVETSQYSPGQSRRKTEILTTDTSTGFWLVLLQSHDDNLAPDWLLTTGISGDDTNTSYPTFLPDISLSDASQASKYFGVRKDLDITHGGDLH